MVNTTLRTSRVTRGICITPKAMITFCSRGPMAAMMATASTIPGNAIRLSMAPISAVSRRR